MGSFLRLFASAREEQKRRAYIQTRRLAACIRALRHGRAAARPLTDMTLACGFTDISHFSRVFHTYAGASPSAFGRSVAALQAFGQRM